MSAAFMCRAGEVQPRLRDKLSREGRSGSVLRASLRDVIIVAAREERQPCSGRFGRLAAVADKRDQPMSESTGRRRRSISIITVVYASHLYCTLKPTPLRRGYIAHVPPSHPRGDRVYNSTSEIAGVAR